MARHTRRLPSNPAARKVADQRAKGHLSSLRWQAAEAEDLEDQARDAMLELRQRILGYVRGRELDITDIAEATGISRQTIHRWVAKDRPPLKVGQQVEHQHLGRGTVESVTRENVDIQFEWTSLTFGLPAERGELATVRPRPSRTG